jgi:hypothetical protein
MSVRIARWYGKPPELFENGHAAEMSDGAFRLYDFLFWVSDRRSSREFELEDADIVETAGISRRTLSDARKQLSTRGLVVCDREPGRPYTYTLCDPVKLRPYPGLPKAKVTYEKPSSPPAELADETPAVPAVEAMPENIGDAWEAFDSCDVSFPFGWNLVVPPETVCDYNPF